MEPALLAMLTPLEMVLVGVAVAPVLSTLLSCMGPSFAIAGDAPKFKCTASMTCGVCQCLLEEAKPKPAEDDLVAPEPSIMAPETSVSFKKAFLLDESSVVRLPKGRFLGRSASRMYLTKSSAAANAPERMYLTKAKTMASMDARSVSMEV